MTILIKRNVIIFRACYLLVYLSIIPTFTQVFSVNYYCQIAILRNAQTHCAKNVNTRIYEVTGLFSFVFARVYARLRANISPGVIYIRLSGAFHFLNVTRACLREIYSRWRLVKMAYLSSAMSTHA